MQIETLDSTLNYGAGTEGKAGEARRPIGRLGQHKASAVSFPA